LEKSKTFGAYADQLTWLRGIAALFVVISHSLRATEVKYFHQDQASQSSLVSFFDLGSFGVVLFFALSGCTLYISNSTKVGRGQVFTFYIKRFFRIWPAFVVSLLFYMAFRLVFASYYGDPHDLWIEKQFLTDYSFSDALSYFTLSFNITGPGEIFNNAYWSLPVEFQYYLLFPLIILSIRYLGLMGPVLIGLFLYLIPKFSLYEFNDLSLFTLAYSFCGGVIIGYLYQRWNIRLNATIGVFLLVILLVAVSIISNSVVSLPSIPIVATKSNWMILFALATIFIMLFTTFSINKRLEAFLKHYGTISYSNYLYHNIFIGISVIVIINMNISDSNLRLFGTLSFTLIASYLVASLSFKYIELPSIRLGRYFAGSKKRKDYDVKQKQMLKDNG
jgi:peptidoglycan/LPS O-acetylase OafA/YrhL